MTPMDENGEDCHYVVPRKRRSCSVDPLRPVNTHHNVGRRSSSIDSERQSSNVSYCQQQDLSLHMDESTANLSAVDSLQGPFLRYCDYLKSISSEEMYESIHSNVLSKVPIGSSVELLDHLVTNYLKAGEVAEPVKVRKIKKKRLTADREVIERGLELTPSPPARVQPRRRSRRLRNSLSVYRQETASSKDAILPETEPLRDLTTPVEEATVELADLDDVSATQELDTTSVITESIDTIDEFEIPTDIANLYLSKGPHSSSQSQLLRTVHELPRKSRGREIIFGSETRRLFDFPEGHWYYQTETKKRQRTKKARKNGWRRCTNQKHLHEIEQTVQKLLEERDFDE